MRQRSNANLLCTTTGCGNGYRSSAYVGCVSVVLVIGTSLHDACIGQTGVAVDRIVINAHRTLSGSGLYACATSDV